MLAGSGATDWALTVLRTRPLLARRRAAGYFWGVGLVRAGDPELIGFESEKWVPTGVGWKLASVAGVGPKRAARRAWRVLRVAARGNWRNRDSGDGKRVAAIRGSAAKSISRSSRT